VLELLSSTQCQYQTTNKSNRHNHFMTILRSSEEHHAVMWNEEWPSHEMVLWRVNKQKKSKK